MSDTPETDNAVFNGYEDGAGMPDIVTADFARKLERERDEARNALRLIADDCEAWLNGESDEPSMDFIKAVRDYARKAVDA